VSDGFDPGDDRAGWEARYLARGGRIDRVPSPWVIERCLALPAAGVILDVAGGTGRHAAPLAAGGRTVIVVDFVERAIGAARARHPRILGVVADVRVLPFRAESTDLIVCVSFLDRSVFPALAALLRAGGALVYETFALPHLDLVERGRVRGPRNPAYLLGAGELSALVAPLIVREYEEGLVVDDAGERHVARVVAVKGGSWGVGVGRPSDEPQGAGTDEPGRS
jgi:hypothetical protein